MRFKNCAISMRLSSAIELAEIFLRENSPMLLELKSKNDWKYGAGTGLNVYEKLTIWKDEIKVYVVPDKRKTKAVAYFQNGSIYIYQSYLDRSRIIDLVGTLLHEYSHYQGFNHNSYFGTSDFKTKAKCLYSVPYYISENVSRWV